MIHETNSLRPDSLPDFARNFLTEDMLLFDIETTGLSPARNSVYCIGCGSMHGEEVRVELFFAERPEDEAEVLAAFFRLAAAHPLLVTFNGTTFDLPFLQKRSALYTDGPAFADPGAHIDLYREARSLRGLLGLSSYRQKSIEQFLGCSREDRYTGGELIEFYQNYVRDPDPELLAPILLHNREDVTGMFDLLGILAYRQFPEGKFAVTDLIEETDDAGRRFMNIRIRPDNPLPQSIHRIADSPDGISILIGREAALARLPIRHGVLRHYFPDPENYYYLPEEDTVIHRSVGQFVDPAHRQRATGKNCCVKKECDYLVFPPCGEMNLSSSPGCTDLKKSYDDPDLCLAVPTTGDDLKVLLRAYFSRISRK